MAHLSENDTSVLNCIFNPSLPLGDTAYEHALSENLTDDEIITNEIKMAKLIEIEGIKAAEKKNYNEAVALFTKAIEVGNTASGFNNRAQVYRLIGDDKKAFEDLEESLILNNGKGRSGCQAYCQRGLLYRKHGQDEQARKNFQAAANLGSQFAKQQLIELNPYAAMCNQMLNQMMKKITNPENEKI